MSYLLWHTILLGVGTACLIAGAVVGLTAFRYSGDLDENSKVRNSDDSD